MNKLYDPTENIASGIYIQVGKIKEIKKSPYTSAQYPKDIDYVVDLTFEGEEGKTFDKTHFLSGNHQKNGKMPPNLIFFLYACDIEGVENNLQMKIVDDFDAGEDTPELKKFFEGKVVKLLSFVSGTYQAEDGSDKPSYKFWGGTQPFQNAINVFSTQTPDEKIIERFREQLKGKYPPKYTPEILTSQSEESSETAAEAVPADLPI